MKRMKNAIDSTTEKDSVVKGKFIIVDGMDGAGKTTSLDILTKLHEDYKLPVKAVNVWTSTTLGKNVRAEIVSHSQSLHPHVATSSCIAAVLHCYHSVVEPLLNAGVNVILDRGPRSSYVLQVCDASEIMDSIPLSLWRIGFSTMIPDIEVVLVCNPETGLVRCMKRDNILDGIEARGVEYHRKTLLRYSQDIPGRPAPHVIKNDGSLRELEHQLKILMRDIYC